MDTTTKAVQQIVDSVTENRRRYVGTRSINWCAYNEHRIRIAVIFPHPKGAWAVAGRHENPWAAYDDQRSLQFETLDAAKLDVQKRNPTIPLTWKAEEVEQAGHEFAAAEKAS